MKRRIYVLVVISLLIGLMAGVGCSAGKQSVGGNSPEVQSFSTVVEMNDKKLAVGAPCIGTITSKGYPLLTVEVKNLGQGPISIAELELTVYGSDGSLVEYWKEGHKWMGGVIVVKDLSPGEIQTLHWKVQYMSSYKVRVKRVE